MCINENSVGCDGQWKSEDCETALNYVCQIPCMWSEAYALESEL